MLIKKRSKLDRAELARSKQSVNDDSNRHHFVEKEQVLSVFEKYQIMSVIGTHTISYCTLKADGTVRSVRDVQQAPGRILRFQDDSQYRCGVLMLIDKQGQADTPDFIV